MALFEEFVVEVQQVFVFGEDGGAGFPGFEEFFTGDENIRKQTGVFPDDNPFRRND